MIMYQRILFIYIIIQNLYLKFTLVTCLAIHSSLPHPSSSSSHSPTSNDNEINKTPTNKSIIITSKKDGGLSKSIKIDQSSIIDNIHHTCQVSSLKGSFDNSNVNPTIATSSTNTATLQRCYNHIQHFRNQCIAFIRSTFLPRGYPHKTPHGYLQYSIWSWIQDLSTQLRGVIATQKVLEGVGVGRADATALSASFNFIIRDGCGMFATLLFTSVASSRFHADVKRWRLFADLVNDVGITLEIAATAFPLKYFLPTICIANMCKAMCGVAAGACGGSINLHWSKGSDISDINAKFGAQHTITGSLGLIFAAMFARCISPRMHKLFWIPLTVIHIIANMNCMKLIAFDYLNTSRMNMITNQFLSSHDNIDSIQDHNATHYDGTENKNSIPFDDGIINTNAILDNPEIISRREPLFFIPFNPYKYSQRFGTPIKIRMGVPFDELLYRAKNQSHSMIRKIVDEMSKNEGYAISLSRKDESVMSFLKKRKEEILVAIQVDANTYTKVKAYFHAFVLGKTLIETRALYESTHDLKYSLEDDEAIIEQVKVDACHKMKRLWPVFVHLASKCGWDLSKSQLRTQGYEILIH